ncbi:MAG: cytochrome c [Gammaproteobacteria bacterium]|nr:cytochrome c [Gammaproteobacteria bacterium]
MQSAKINNFGLGIMLLLLTPGIALSDTAKDAPQAPATMQDMDHSKMKMDDAATGEHWMAPTAAAKQRNPVAANRASIERGRKLFQANCVTCHGAQGKGDGPAAAALNPKPADLSVMAGQHPDGDFAWKISNGRGAMPPWKQTLKPNQIWDLVNFVQSMAPKGQAGAKHDHSAHKHEH